MATASALTQNDITWTFDGTYTYGQYANGDYWVVAQGGTPIVTVSAIGHTNAAGKIADQVNSWVNPRWSNTYASQYHGYDSRIAGYSAALNSQPTFHLHPGESVVSVTSWTTLHGDEGSYLADAAVLTCVDEEQPSGTMRPPYCRPTREADSSADTLRYNVSQINWNRLPSVSKPASTPAIATSLARVAKVWIDNVQNYPTSSRAHPTNNMRDYSRDMAWDVSDVSCQLMLDYTQSEKQALLYAFLQLGIDLYGEVLDGGAWPCDGGHANSRHFPIAFAGWILGVDAMNDIDLTLDGVYRFGEDGNTYYYDDETLPAYVNAETNAVSSSPGPGYYACRGEKGWIDKTNGGNGDTVLWRIADSVYNGFLGGEYLDIAYWSNTVAGDHQWRFEAYRGCCTVRAWIGYGLAGKMMGPTFKAAYGHDAFFDYVDRWMVQSSSAASALFSAKYGGGEIIQQTSGITWIDDMWDAYHDYEIAETQNIPAKQSIRMRF